MPAKYDEIYITHEGTHIEVTAYYIDDGGHLVSEVLRREYVYPEDVDDRLEFNFLLHAREARVVIKQQGPRLQPKKTLWQRIKEFFA